MSERRRLNNPTVLIASDLHDADGLALNDDGEVQGYKDLSQHVASVTLVSSLEDFHEKFGYLDPVDQLAALEDLEAEHPDIVIGAKPMRSLWAECDEAREDHERRIKALTSLAKMETRLVLVGDFLLRIGRRLRRPFASQH